MNTWEYLEVGEPWFNYSNATETTNAPKRTIFQVKDSFSSSLASSN